jgi:GNAT superfamily N-acetyltransferase
MAGSSNNITAADLSIRSATSADTDAILDLVRLSLGEGSIPRERAYWEWKHVENPFGTSPVLVAESAGQIVGLRVFMRWKWETDGEIIDAVRAVDTATHPDWRGKGVFSRLTLALVERMRGEGVSFVFNTPNSQSRPGYLKMGWTGLGRIPLMIRPVRPARIFAHALASPRSARQEDDAQDAAVRLPLPGAADLVAQTELEALLNVMPADGRLRTPKTMEYLTWRYARVPGFSYHATWDFRGDEGAALVCRMKMHGPLRELRVCELIAGPGAESRRLLRKMLRHAVHEAGCDFVGVTAVPGSEERGALFLAGFVPVTRFGPIFTVRLLNPISRGMDPLRLESWRPAIGDLELF